MLLNIVSLSQNQYDALTPEERSIVFAYNNFVKESDMWPPEERIEKIERSRGILRALRVKLIYRLPEEERGGRNPLSSILNRITPYT